MASDEGGNNPIVSIGSIQEDTNVQSEENTEDTSLDSKRKRKSKWWDYYKLVTINDVQFAECNYCKAHLKAPGTYGTSNLKKHYEQVCKKRPKKMDIRQSLFMGNKKPGGS